MIPDQLFKLSSIILDFLPFKKESVLTVAQMLLAVNCFQFIVMIINAFSNLIYIGVRFVFIVGVILMVAEVFSDY